MAPPDAVLFDLDGTLVHSEPLCEASVRAAAASMGLALSHEDYAPLVGMSWEAVFRALAGDQGPDAVARLGRSVFDHYDRFMEAGLPVVPGGAELIRRLHRRVRLGIVTGSSRPQLAAVLAQLGIEGLLDVTVTEEDLHRSKPDPEGYGLALSMLGVAPERALVFEDSTAGIAAARAAGCKVVAVTGTNHYGQDQSGAAAYVEDLTEIDLPWCSALFAA